MAKLVKILWQSIEAGLCMMLASVALQAQAQEMAYICPNSKTIMAADVRTPDDARVFLGCAVDFAKAKGLEAARVAFNQMGQWRSDETYIFAGDHNHDGAATNMHIYPPDTSRENQNFVEVKTGFGGEVFDEFYEIAKNFNQGFAYYKFQRPSQSKKQPKVSYIMKVAHSSVEGLSKDAVFGVGIYPRGVRGDCPSVTARQLNENPSLEDLQAFVRCAADLYAQRQDLDYGQATLRSEQYRWGQISVYVLNTQLKHRYNWLTGDFDGPAIYESLFDGGSYSNSTVHLQPYRWLQDKKLLAKTDGQKTERAYKIIEVGEKLGERFVYYRARNHKGQWQRKVDFLKRVPVPPTSVMPGGSVLVGSGYFLPEGEKLPMGNCMNPMRYLTASQVQTRDDLEAFVQKARCYIQTYGLAKAKVEFKKADWYDEDRNIYIYVEGNQPTAAQAMVHVFPPDPTKEGSSWGEPFIDKFKNSYYPEVYRILSQYGSGWTYYTSTSGGKHPERYKAGYIMELKNVGGQSVTIGSGLYEPDTPGACRDMSLKTQRIRAATVHGLVQRSAVSDATLQALKAFVNCAAFEVEKRMHSRLPARFLSFASSSDRLNYFLSGVGSFDATVNILNRGSSWRFGQIYLFGYRHGEGESGKRVLDSSYANYKTGATSNTGGAGRSEWGDQQRFGRAFMGPERLPEQTRQNMLQVVNATGEAFVYYINANDNRKTIAYIKRVHNNDFPYKNLSPGMIYEGQDAFATPPMRPDFYVGAGVKLPQSVSR